MRRYYTHSRVTNSGGAVALRRRLAAGRGAGTADDERRNARVPSVRVHGVGLSRRHAAVSFVLQLGAFEDIRSPVYIGVLYMWSHPCDGPIHRLAASSLTPTFSPSSHR